VVTVVGTARQFVIAIVLASLVGLMATICLATAFGPTTPITATQRH
jgi:hypothetical protein